MIPLLACAPGPTVLGELEVTLDPSERVPAVATLAWDGPAGEARLEVRTGLQGWRTLAHQPVEDGPSTLPLALLPAGRAWDWRVVVAVDGGVWESEAGRFDVPEPPASLVAPHLERTGPDSVVRDGWLVGYRYARPDHPDEAAAWILDGDGAIVWWLPPRADGSRVIRARPSLDGRAVVVLLDHLDGEARKVLRVPLDGSEGTETDVPDATHDFVERDDGTFVVVTYVASPQPLAGWRNPVVADGLTAFPEGSTGGDGAWELFDFFAEAPYDPWPPCSHAGFGQFVPDASEWTHVNSLLEDPVHGGFLLMVRHLDAMVHVTPEGELDWQAGGRDATLRPVGAAAFEHGHASHAWADDDGTLHALVFDNGNHSPQPVVSRVVEVSVDPGAGTVREVWALEDPRGEFVDFLGDARRLPGGHTLVVWTDRGEASEVTAEGEEVWRVQGEGSLGRMFWVPRDGLRP